MLTDEDEAGLVDVKETGNSFSALSGDCNFLSVVEQFLFILERNADFASMCDNRGYGLWYDIRHHWWQFRFICGIVIIAMLLYILDNARLYRSDSCDTVYVVGLSCFRRNLWVPCRIRWP